MAIDFTMTEEQELLLSSIRELINNEFPEEYFRTHDEEGKYPREFVKASPKTAFRSWAFRKSTAASRPTTSRRCSPLWKSPSAARRPS